MTYFKGLGQPQKVIANDHNGHVLWRMPPTVCKDGSISILKDVLHKALGTAFGFAGEI